MQENRRFIGSRYFQKLMSVISIQGRILLKGGREARTVDAGCNRLDEA